MNESKSNIYCKTKQRILYLILSGLIVLCDQVSKWMVTEALYRPQTGQQGSGFLDWYKNTPEILPFINIQVTSFFNLVMVWNKGVSFGMMSNHGDNGPYILIGLSALITLFFLIWMMRNEDKLHALSFALIIGGAIGNMIDRARFGAVIDFLDFHAFGYHWPAFNIADTCVVLGVGLLVILSFAFDLLSKHSYRKTTS